MVYGPLQSPRICSTLGNKLSDSTSADGNQRKLGSYKEAICNHEHENRQNPNKVGQTTVASRHGLLATSLMKAVRRA